MFSMHMDFYSMYKNLFLCKHLIETYELLTFYAELCAFFVPSLRKEGLLCGKLLNPTKYQCFFVLVDGKSAYTKPFLVEIAKKEAIEIIQVSVFLNPVSASYLRKAINTSKYKRFECQWISNR